jgi:hypothetical protein
LRQAPITTTVSTAPAMSRQIEHVSSRDQAAVLADDLEVLAPSQRADVWRRNSQHVFDMRDWQGAGFAQHCHRHAARLATTPRRQDAVKAGQRACA